MGGRSRLALHGLERPPSRSMFGLRDLAGELLGVASGGSVVATQVLRQGGQGHRHRLPLPSLVDRRQGQECLQELHPYRRRQVRVGLNLGNEIGTSQGRLLTRPAALGRTQEHGATKCS